MATLVELNKVYHCQSSSIGSASIHVVSGNVNLKGSNVTQYTTDGTNKLIIPKKNTLLATGDSLGVGIHLVAGLPEWILFEGTGEVWVKMTTDSRIKPGDE